MANYVNLTLDTLGPQGVKMILNEGESTTTSTGIRVKFTCTDESTTGYQMKIWGTAPAPTEADARWVNLVQNDVFIIPGGAGTKTLYAKLRDDVYNESATVSATIKYVTDRPTVSGLFISPSKISHVEGKNLATGSFGFSEDICAAKVMIVKDINNTHDNQTNILIPTTNGSCLELEDGTVLSSDKMSFEGKTCDEIFTILYNIKAQDITAADPGDGVKIIKVFVQSAESKLWSI